MLLRYVYDDQLAQASYLVGCAATGEALVVDPMRDVEPYLRAAERDGLRITHVTETHIHADFVSGSRELAARTGATIYLSDMGDEHWKYGYADQPNVVLVRHGDTWMVGNVRVEVLHTPGHTPEHIAFQITDTAATDQPLGVFSGDFLFAGDIGRPDLLEAAAGLVGTKEPGARRQFQTMRHFQELPDYLQIWPAHGAGSACGKALGAIPSTTLGYEKRVNPAFQIDDEERFVGWLLDGQPEAPWYFARMKYVNKVGPALLSELTAPEQVDRAAIDAAVQAGALVVDLRSQAAYARTHIPGTLSIPASNKLFSTFVGWFVDYSKPTYLIVEDQAQLGPALTALRAIGIDDLRGYATPEVLEADTASLPTLDSEELARLLATEPVLLLDVRGQSEYQQAHLPGALHIPLGYLARRLDEIPRDRPVVALCASGYRAQIAASLLRRAGSTRAAVLTDSQRRWLELATAAVA